MTIQTNSSIRIAQPSDEPEVIRLVQMMHAESGWLPLDVDCVRETLALAFEKKGGILAVIGAPGHIRAMIYIRISHWWFTHNCHLEELFCWVHPDHRKSDYARLLSEYAKSCSDELSRDMGHKVPLTMGVLTNRRMAAKVRLYRRFFGIPAGAFFLHNAEWVNKDDVCEEDFWRVPKIANLFFKRAERNESRDKPRARAS